MVELIQAIALLCTVTATNSYGLSSSDFVNTDEYQLNCQKYYINCIDKEHKLKDCILKRKTR